MSVRAIRETDVETGCDDALLTSDAGVQRAAFDREASSFAEAVASAITAIESAVPDAQVIRIGRLEARATDGHAARRTVSHENPW